MKDIKRDFYIQKLLHIISSIFIQKIYLLAIFNRIFKYDHGHFKLLNWSDPRIVQNY